MKPTRRQSANNQPVSNPLAIAKVPPAPVNLDWEPNLPKPVADAYGKMELRLPTGKTVRLKDLKDFKASDCLNWIPDPQKRELVGLVCSAIGLLPPGPEPAWARNALKHAAKNLFAATRLKLDRDEATLGLFMGLMLALPTPAGGIQENHPALDLLRQFDPLVRLLISQSPPEVAKDAYFEAEVEGRRLARENAFMTTTIQHCVVLAGAWRHWEGKSGQAVFREFRKAGLALEGTDRQFRRLLATIGFPGERVAGARTSRPSTIQRRKSGHSITVSVRTRRAN